MNDQHRQVAQFILDKLNQTPMRGEEAETVASAKQWLGLIVSGQMEVKQIEQPKPELVPQPRDPELPAGMP